MKPVSRLPKAALRRALQAIAFILFTLLGLVSALARRFRAMPDVEPDQVRRILVIRLDLLGDLVMSLPAVRALKRTYKNSEVTLLTLPFAARLLPLVPEADHLLAFDVNLIRSRRELLRPANYGDFFRTVGQLRSERYDMCLSLHGRFACVMAWLSGCPRRYGYRGEAYPFMLTHTLPGGRYGVRQHEVFYNLELAQYAGAEPDGQTAAKNAPHLTVPPTEQRRMRRVLGEFDIRPETIMVVIHPGASNGSAKRWPPTYWGQVANRMHGELKAALVLTGTAAEAEIVREVEGACAFGPIVLAGQTTVPQLAALLKRADLLISGDTGPAHVAAAVGTSVVSIFGPTDPVVYAPYATNVTILRRQLWCSPCYDASAVAECRFGHVNCMRELSPEEVYEAAARMLQKRLQRAKG